MAFALSKFARSGFMAWMGFALIGIYGLLPLRNKLRFGIDLVGGTYITLGVNVEKALEAELLDKQDALEKQLKELKKELPVMSDCTNNTLVLTFKDSFAASQAAELISSDRTVEYELNDVKLTIRLPERSAKNIMATAVQRNIEVLRTRLDKLSVAEIAIAAKGDRQIIVELPDVADPRQAKSMIGTAAILEFKIVEKMGRSPEDILYEYDGVLPHGMEILPGKMTIGEPTFYYLVTKRAEVTGKHLKDARPDFDQQTGSMAIHFSMTQDGSHKFYELTGRNFGRQLAAVLDGVVLTAPTIQSAISSDGRITGTFSPAQAKELALLLKSGSFVAPVTFEEERQVGPSLGGQAIKDGVLSCMVALALLFLFSVVFYNVTGLLAFVTLLYNLLLVLMGMAWLRATLTLPGIAGMVLTVGMAIDASILIYERIKEELAAGVPLKKAIADGFADARHIIWHANVTTLIVGIILYTFGTGPIQGFAVTMILGIIATLITGLFFLKSLFNVLLNVFDVQKLRI